MRFQPITYSNSGPLLNRALITILEYMNGRRRMEREYFKTLDILDEARKKGDQTPYFDIALNQINIQYDICGRHFEDIPQHGPVIVLANHPFGIVDGLITGSLIHQRRQDFQILANHALNAAQPMREWLIPLDDAGTKKAEAANRPAIMKAMRYLHKGGCLCIFPAGRVARPAKWGAQIDDYTWQEFAARMILSFRKSAQKSGHDITIVPLFFEGQNSALFHMSHIIHFMMLRRALIVAEALKKQGDTLKVHIGKPIAASQLQPAKDAALLTQSLRQRVFDLQPAPVYFPASYAQKALPKPIES